MTAMTIDGVTITNTPGQEQYETFARKIGRQSPHEKGEPRNVQR